MAQSKNNIITHELRGKVVIPSLNLSVARGEFFLFLRIYPKINL